MELFLESFWPMFRAGLTVSVPLMLVSFALGLVLAFIIALMRMSKLPHPRFFSLCRYRKPAQGRVRRRAQLPPLCLC